VRLRTGAGLATVYVVWGSTYLAIAIAIRSLPPLLMLSVRYLIAGALVYAWARLRGAGRPTRIHWRSAFLIGAGLILLGNGGVGWAEQHVHSGIVALVVAVVPLWLALLDREPLSWPALAGLGLGFGGVALLVGVGGSFQWQAIVVVVTSLGWAAGSLYARRAPRPDSPLLGVGQQMLAGGALLLVAGAVGGELPRVELPSAAALWALAYLVVIGSILTFTIYNWLLRNARTSLVGTYAFVNPVVAVLLGALFNNEPLTLRTLLAGAVIVAGVALIVVAPRRRYAQQREDLQPALGQASLR
jgi:drug/metabolite transporter (DMT)-like permease